ncbi:MAG TPA: hypothetical protein VJS43_12425, partial [Candidatus Acidoferrales bacterium]|nr:hypothetical protein [Candidatus Acidoferrales bacterium]
VKDDALVVFAAIVADVFVDWHWCVASIQAILASEKRRCKLQLLIGVDARNCVREHGVEAPEGGFSGVRKAKWLVASG